MCLTNQKNGWKKGVIHYEAISGDSDPKCLVLTLVNRVYGILWHGCTEKSLLCDYWDGIPWAQVTGDNMVTGVAGGAMALKINDINISNSVIKKYFDGQVWLSCITPTTKFDISLLE